MKPLSIAPDLETPHPQQIGRGALRARRVYLGLAAFFWLAVLAQAFLAGAGIFVSGAWMGMHSALGHLLSSPVPLIPLLLVILSFAGRLPKRDRWLCGLLFFLTMVQPVMLYLRGVAPLLSALHPVNALLLFALPMYLIARVRQTLRTTPQPTAPREMIARTSAD